MQTQDGEWPIQCIEKEPFFDVLCKTLRHPSGQVEGILARMNVKCMNHGGNIQADIQPVVPVASAIQ